MLDVGEVIADALVSGTPWTGVGVAVGLSVGTAVGGAVGDGWLASLQPASSNRAAAGIRSSVVSVMFISYQPARTMTPCDRQ